MTSNTKTNLWRSSAGETVSGPRFDSDGEADLAIIGGGFTGCAAALDAARRGASVAVF